MKVAGSRARAFCTRPDTAKCGALLYGTDGALVGLARQELVQALTEGDEMRLDRLEPVQAVRDPAGIDAALRARPFFGGRPVVLMEGAGEALARPLAEVLQEIRPDDAFLILTAGSLPARSALRKLFENDGRLVSLAFHGGSPGRAEVEDTLAEKGLRGRLTSDAVSELVATAQGIDRGQLLQLVEKIRLYMVEREPALDAPELNTLLPEATETQLDRLVFAVGEGRTDLVGPLMTQVSASGLGPVAILIGAVRHFRVLLALATAADGIGPALARLRPPVYGPRRDALAAQARSWSAERLETANRLLFQTDRRLRSTGSRPDYAMVERSLVRLSMMAGQRHAD